MNFKIQLNPTKKLFRKINKTITEMYNPRIKQAIFVFTTDVNTYHEYKLSFDTFPAMGTGILTTIISEVSEYDISKEEYLRLLYAIYNKWDKLPMILRGYNPKQVRWFRRNFGKRVFSENATVDWWRDIR